MSMCNPRGSPLKLMKITSWIRAFLQQNQTSCALQDEWAPSGTTRPRPPAACFLLFLQLSVHVLNLALAWRQLLLKAAQLSLAFWQVLLCWPAQWNGINSSNLELLLCWSGMWQGRGGGFGTDNNSNNNRLFMAPHLVRTQSAYKDIRLHSWPDALWPDVLLSEAFFGLLSNLMTYAEVWECFALLLGTASCRVMSQWVQHFCLKFGPTPTPILSERLMHTIVSQPFFSLMDMIF